jgi:predicted tellurium resistance membrane protein TerC
MMDATLYDTILPILKIIWIDILLSGDNAMVIALACRNLPKRQRKWGIALGAGAAVTLRVIFMFIVVWLLALPFLKLAGGLLLFWIAWQLLSEDEDDRTRDRRQRQPVARRAHDRDGRRRDVARQCRRHRRRGEGLLHRWSCSASACRSR